MLYQEIDYILEGRSADRFRRNFRGTPWVRAPVVHWEYCSSRVLTLEYLPGVHVCGLGGPCRGLWEAVVGLEGLRPRISGIPLF